MAKFLAPCPDMAKKTSPVRCSLAACRLSRFDDICQQYGQRAGTGKSLRKQICLFCLVKHDGERQTVCPALQEEHAQQYWRWAHATPPRSEPPCGLPIRLPRISQRNTVENPHRPRQQMSTSGDLRLNPDDMLHEINTDSVVADTTPAFTTIQGAQHSCVLKRAVIFSTRMLPFSPIGPRTDWAAASHLGGPPSLLNLFWSTTARNRVSGRKCAG